MKAMEDYKNENIDDLWAELIDESSDKFFSEDEIEDLFIEDDDNSCIALPDYATEIEDRESGLMPSASLSLSFTSS